MIPIQHVMLNESTREAVLLVDKRLYSQEAVDHAANAFSKSCAVAVRDYDEHHHQVVLRPYAQQADVEQFGYEFFNYLLGVMQAG